MTDAAPTEKKKSAMNPIAVVGIGCLVIIVFLGVVASLALRFFARSIGTAVVQSAIENKTGIKANLQDLQNGKMTVTDPKTGQTVNIGTGQMPDNFPKDFPQYPGAKVESSMGGTGGTQNQESGVWVSFSTADSVDKVTAFYKSALESGGWKTTGTFSVSGTTTYTVEKDTEQGSVVVSADSSKQQTGIMVTISTKN